MKKKSHVHDLRCVTRNSNLFSAIIVMGFLFASKGTGIQEIGKFLILVASNLFRKDG